MHRKRYRLVLIRFAVVMLLASLAGFATLAKNTQYLPKSNPARFLSIASKMKADCSSIDVEPPLPQARIMAGSAALPAQPELFVRLFQEQDSRFVEPIGIFVSSRHRAPPVLLS
ncbi:MAG: hypothetical protein ACRD59_16915 [Candidatus Acidiferrales bacterium]